MECHDCQDCKRDHICFNCSKLVCNKCCQDYKCQNFHSQHTFCKDCLFRRCNVCSRSICEWCYKTGISNNCAVHSDRNSCILLCMYCRHASKCRCCNKEDCRLAVRCQGSKKPQCSKFVEKYCEDCSISESMECILCEKPCGDCHSYIRKGKKVCERCVQAISQFISLY